jgi:hypothetical protein
LAAKITGMLLVLNDAELPLLLGSPPRLQRRFSEALGLLGAQPAHGGLGCAPTGSASPERVCHFALSLTVIDCH